MKLWLRSWARGFGAVIASVTYELGTYNQARYSPSYSENGEGWGWDYTAARGRVLKDAVLKSGNEVWPGTKRSQTIHEMSFQEGEKGCLHRRWQFATRTHTHGINHQETFYSRCWVIPSHVLGYKGLMLVIYRASWESSYKKKASRLQKFDLKTFPQRRPVQYWKQYCV